MNQVLKWGVLIGFVILTSPFAVADNIIYVDVNAPNDPGAGTGEDPFLRIQDGIDAAQPGETVEIRPGLYIGPGNYNLDPNGKTITVRSTNPNEPNIVADTIIDANQDGRGFYIHKGEGPDCIISGLTITNGNTNERGGGIYCQESSPSIHNCVLKGNSASLSGGGVFCDDSNSLIIGCTITGNLAQDAGGVGCWWGSGTELRNCILSNNESTGSYGGGGLECRSDCNIGIINCTLAGNSATNGYGGAVRCDGSQVNIANCILWANSAYLGSQIALESFTGTCSGTVSYSDVQGGDSQIYVDLGSSLTWGAEPGGTDNLDTDPCFVSFDVSGEPDVWDFHLQSLYGRWDPNNQEWVADSNLSVCIDAGDPNSDWSSEPWPNGKRVNMGCFGGTAEASKNGNQADFDINGNVDFEDYALFVQRWGSEGNFIEDLTLDGVVNFSDLDIFCDNWLGREIVNPADFDNSGSVDFEDFALFVQRWGSEGDYAEDLTSDGVVDFDDLDLFCDNWLWQR